MSIQKKISRIKRICSLLNISMKTIRLIREICCFLHATPLWRFYYFDLILIVFVVFGIVE